MLPKTELWLQGLHLGQPMRLKPRGGSMTPILRDGDIVTIAPGNGARVGDIILTSNAESWLMHRLIWKSGRSLITKGDSLLRLDPPTGPEKVLGRAILRVRDGKARSLVSFKARFCGLVLNLSFPWLLRYFPRITALKRLCLKGVHHESEC